MKLKLVILLVKISSFPGKMLTFCWVLDEVVVSCRVDLAPAHADRIV